MHCDCCSTCLCVATSYLKYTSHDDVIKWKKFPRYWPFVREIHRSPVNSPHKGQWRGALMFCLIYAWTNSSANNGDTGELKSHRVHYDVILMYTNVDKIIPFPRHIWQPVHCNVSRHPTKWDYRTSLWCDNVKIRSLGFRGKCQCHIISTIISFVTSQTGINQRMAGSWRWHKSSTCHAIVIQHSKCFDIHEISSAIVMTSSVPWWWSGISVPKENFRKTFHFFCACWWPNTIMCGHLWVHCWLKSSLNYTIAVTS